MRARAAGGYADAAKRLLRDLYRCSRLHSSKWTSDGATNDLTRKSTDGMSAAQLRTYQLQLDAMELRQQGVRKNQELCAGVSDKMLEALVPSIAQAARLGDEQARACYLDRGPLYDARSLLKHPESLRNYGNAASALIDSGLAAGDWRVVDLLQQAYEPGAQSPGPILRAAIRTRVSPFPKQGLDDALGLAVGAGSVWPRAQVLHALA